MSGRASSGQVKDLALGIGHGVPSDMSAEDAKRCLGKMDLVHRWTRLGIEHDLANVNFDAVEALLCCPQPPPNPHPIVKPTRKNPDGWRMMSWREQLAALQDAFSGLDATGLPEMAEGYLGQHGLMSLIFKREDYDKPYPLWDGILVFALPGKAAKKLGIGNLWADVAKGPKGKGLWGRLCENVLFPQFTLPRDKPRFPSFNNYRAGEMGSDRFKPETSVATWLQGVEAQTKGDFACRPCSFGHLAGYSVQAARFEAEKLLAVTAPTWLFQYLVADPSCITPESLWPDAGGDCYRFEDSRDFAYAPRLPRAAGELHFHTLSVASPRSNSGAVLVSR